MRFKNLFFLVFVLSVSSCNCNSLKVDVSDIKLNLTIHRFDRELFALKNKDAEDVDKLKNKYAAFFKLYSYMVIQLGDPDNERFSEYLQGFLNDSIMNEVYDKCQEIFPNLNAQEAALTEAFKHYKYYFPKGEVPQLFVHISGFNQSIVIAEDILGISIDKYLGEDCNFYAQLGTPLYARYRMRPERIVLDAMLAFGSTEFEFNNTQDNVVNNMIYRGKIRYFLQAMNPKTLEADIMGYKPEQMKWCKNNEENIWGYIIEEKHLFSSEYRLIMQYINDGPFTKGMPRESPSRIGIWIGLQIVKSYMKNNPDISLPVLMAENDYEKILRESGYQP